MFRKTIIILLIFVCKSAISEPIFKQNDSVSLADYLRYGLENNFSLQIARNQQSAREISATHSNAGQLPTISIDASYTNDLSSSKTQPHEGEMQRVSNLDDQIYDVGINLDWTIFDGFSLKTTYQQLKLIEQQGKLQTRLAIEDYVSKFVAEYYNYIQQKIRLQNFQYAMALSKERMRIVEIKYHIGNFSRLDYLQAKVDFNADSTNYMHQREALQTTLINLNRLLSADDVISPLTIHDSLIEIKYHLSFDELWQSTLSTNSDLLIASQNILITESDYKKVIARNYPYIKFKAGYGYTMHDYNKGATDSKSNWGGNASVVIGFTIFDGKLRTNQKVSHIDVENAALTKDNLQLSLKADLNNLWQAYENNWQILLLESQNLDVAKENYEQANLRYSKGELSGFAIREAQKSLLDAEERLLSAEYDTKMCEISLLQLSGRILEYLQ